MNKCKLPGCERFVPAWRSSCCCKSHNGRYAALVRHKKIDHTGIVAPTTDYIFARKLPHKTIIYDAHIRAFYKNAYRLQKAKSKTSAHSYRSLRRSSGPACPKWANKNLIKDFYRKAIYLTETTGIKYEVDHIIPLSHPLVCGLHNEYNLQVITKAENREKSNIFLID